MDFNLRSLQNGPASWANVWRLPTRQVLNQSQQWHYPLSAEYSGALLTQG